MTHDSPSRAAPRPLSVYLGAAMLLLDANANDAQREAHKLAVTRMIEGIRKYQGHPWRREDSGLETVWRAEGARLLFCPAVGERREALLVIPSMINGSEILDLLPGWSYVRWMAGQGYDVFLLDWGVPVDDPGLQDVAGVCERILGAARFVQGRSGKPVKSLGYCMGGTLLLGAAAREPDLFSDLVVLSAPWDFHAGDVRMLAQVMTGAASAMQLLEKNPGLPVDWIQNVFARVNPALAMNKFSNFLEMAEGSFEQKIFIAVEDWLNGGQDLPAGVARACIMDWYGRNMPGRGEWADLSALDNHRVLIVAAGKDILVPPESASAAMQQIPGADLMQPPCGHISLMAGRKAPEMVWRPVLDWLNAPLHNSPEGQ
ncbi:MAG: alpha/beta hydrolase [Micavibrio aeruginosavorus]|nr:alpha/beta hydrolase [Micavibrio aeruginosavorus]